MVLSTSKVFESAAKGEFVVYFEFKINTWESPESKTKYVSSHPGSTAQGVIAVVRPLPLSANPNMELFLYHYIYDIYITKISGDYIYHKGSTIRRLWQKACLEIMTGFEPVSSFTKAGAFTMVSS